MPKFEEPFDSTKSVFKAVIDFTELHKVLTFDIITNNKLREVFKTAKTNDYEKHRTGVDIKIFINEEVFEMLDEVQQNIVVEEALAYVEYNYEKDTVKINKPDVMGHSGVIGKFGDKLYLNTLTIIKEAFNSLKEQKEVEGAEA
tara:strand:- start:128 stop:559 length:432 start_codon:yes stop_codon:yes gene_type:complete